MRNLKKALSLVLAMVMLLGMMVVGAGATEFRDDSSIEYKEAADVLSELKVIVGRNGNFEPKTALTRAEGAAIVYRMLTSGTSANPVGGATGFVDVDNDPSFAWATGIIADLAGKGIISGVDATHFAPGDPLIGAAFGKMLLVALGYNPEYQGYTGGGWDGNVIRDCYSNGLSVSGVVMSNVITREQAAQMALNTLQAPMVYQKGGIQIGDVVIPGDRAEKIEGTGTASKDFRASATDDAFMEFCEAYFPALKLKDDVDAYGRPSNVWVLDKKDIATSSKDAVATFTNSVNADAVTKALKDCKNPDASFKIKVDGADGATVANISNIAAAVAAASGKGVTITVYANEDGKITDVVVINTYFGKVTKVVTNDDKTTVTISRLTKGAPSANSMETDVFEKDEYVIYTVGEDGIETMALAESFTGKITATSSSYLRLDGEKYDYSKALDKTTAKVGDATIYLDEAHNVIYVGEVEAVATNYLYVKGADLYFDTISIRAVFADGTTKIVQLDTATRFDSNQVVANGGSALSNMTAANLSTASSNLVNNVYPYTETDDDTVKLTGAKLATEVKATASSSSGVTNGDTRHHIVKGKTPLYVTETATTTSWTNSTSANSPVVANNNTVYVMASNGTTYTGYKNVPSLNNVHMIYVLNKNNPNLADLVFIASSDPGEDENATWIYITDETAKESYSDYTLWTAAYVDGKKTDVMTTSNNAFASAGLYKGTKTNSKGHFTDVDSMPTGSAQATVAGDGTLTLTNGMYSYTDETLFVFVNGKTVTTSNDTSDIILKNDAAAKGSNITYVYVSEKNAAGDAAKVVYVIAAKKDTGASVDVGATPNAADLNEAIANAEGSEVNLTGVTTIPAGTVIPSDKTVTVPAGVTINSITVNGTLKTESAITGTVTLNGTLEIASATAGTTMPALAAGAKGTVKVDDEVTANCGTLADIFANAKNYAKNTVVSSTTGPTVTTTITANPVTFTGEGDMTGFENLPVGGSTGTGKSALYNIKFPESVVSGTNKRTAESITVEYKDGTTRAMLGTSDLDGEVVLLLDTNVEKITYVFAAEDSGLNRPAITYVFNIG